MDHQDQYKWTIIYSDHSGRFIHLDHLINSNSNNQIILADISNRLPPSFAWKNGDLLIREWLKNNHDCIQYNNIAILEWDVLINIKLPDIKIHGLVARNRIDYHPDHQWMWFREVSSLEEYKAYAIGAAPFGVIFLTKQCIEILLDKKHDKLYNKSIQAELRLPSVLNSEGIPINGFSMPFVSCVPSVYNRQPGIHHPIKNYIHSTTS